MSHPLTLLIPTMKCEGCSSRISKIVSQYTAPDDYAVDLASKTVQLKREPAEYNTLLRELSAAGYGVSQA